MLHKTRGIVLNYIKYRETSVIARIYTEHFGIQSYIINGIRSPRSKKGLALLQPLTILDMVVYHKRERPDSLHRISEYKTSDHFHSIPFEIKKSTIALFVTELLSKVLKEEEHHGAAFEFLYQFVKALDERKSGYENLHIHLLVLLTHYLGFGIHNKADLEGHSEMHPVRSDIDEVYQAVLLFNESGLNAEGGIGNLLRKDVLEFMVNYYARHVEGFDRMKSLEVLAQIFR